jgi:hypothetical protein
VVHVLEEDDGSGWVKVTDSDSNQGLVPASYLDDASGGLFESTEQKFQQASGMYGTSTAYRLVRSVFLTVTQISSTGSLRLPSSRTRRTYDQ